HHSQQTTRIHSPCHTPPPPPSPLFPYTTLFRSRQRQRCACAHEPRHSPRRSHSRHVHLRFSRPRSVDAQYRCADRLGGGGCRRRSEEHTSEPQSLASIVWRFLVGKKNWRCIEGA